MLKKIRIGIRLGLGFSLVLALLSIASLAEATQRIARATLLRNWKSPAQTRWACMTCDAFRMIQGIAV
jgi:hypothetical protein